MDLLRTRAVSSQLKILLPWQHLKDYLPMSGVYEDHCIIGGCQCVIVVSITPLSAPLILNYLVGPGLVSLSLVSCHTLMSYIPENNHLILDTELD